MSEMGILRVTIGVESHTRRGEVRELPGTMVDTGSEYTWIPRIVLESLDIGVERAERFVTADGRIITREMGYAIVHAGGARTSDEVVFADAGDMALLGAHTIEGMNLRVDLNTKRLVPAGPVPAAASGAHDTTQSTYRSNAVGPRQPPFGISMNCAPLRVSISRRVAALPRSTARAPSRVPRP
jgi:predicted aspartyl protease